MSNMVYTPPEQKLKNAGKVDYLGHSKIIANLDDDNIIGFKDAHIRRGVRKRLQFSVPFMRR